MLLHYRPASYGGPPVLHLSQCPPRIRKAHRESVLLTKIKLAESFKGLKRQKKTTDNFLLGAQHAELAKADVEGRTPEGAIRLAHHDHVDSSGQSGGIETSVELLHRHKHRLGQLAHEIHGLGLQNISKTTLWKNVTFRYSDQVTKCRIELKVLLKVLLTADLWNQNVRVTLGPSLYSSLKK